MILSLAPMEGITGYVFRQAHAQVFGGLDRAYTPFVCPPRVGSAFGKRYRVELDPANNQGLAVIPQLLAKDADEFVWAAGLLAEMGYGEVNLNLGCPSGTVASKGKGAGFLRDPDALGRFLLDVCERSPIPVSVKTRVGVVGDDEFEDLLEMYRACPLAELIVHPRVQKDMYRGRARRELYGEALASCPFPVAYNGDVFTVEDARSLGRDYPATRHVMLGRGVLVNPALPRMVGGGASLSIEELRRFHDLLFCGYEAQMGGNAVMRMKEWWSYAKDSFAEPARVARAVRRARTVPDYLAAAEKVFAEQGLSAG